MGHAHAIPPSDEPRLNAGAPAGSSGRQLVHAGVLADARGVHAPGALLLEGSVVLAAGAPESIGPAGAGVEVVDRTDALVCPPLVNPHVHLDLSDLVAPEGQTAFSDWLGRVLAHRTMQQAPGAVEAAVSLGVDQSLAGGCPFVGDICGSERALDALSGTKAAGIGFLEVLGHGGRAASGVDRIAALGDRAGRGGRLRPGVSPHAPYSTGPELFDAAARSGLFVASHLAESPAELIWCRTGEGPFKAMLERAGYPPGSVAHPGCHPVDAFLDRLPAHRGVAVHLNYTEPAHLDALAERGVTVVFCPRASRFLGHPEAGEPGHAWRAMLAHGIPVALGTDGRPCLPGPGARGGRLSVLDDGFELQSTDGARLEEWLPMATVHGAGAIGLDPAEVTLVPGPKTGVLSVPLLRSGALDIDPEGAVEWLVRDLERVPEWSSGG